MRNRNQQPGQGQQPSQNARANPSLLHTTKTVFGERTGPAPRFAWLEANADPAY